MTSTLKKALPYLKKPWVIVGIIVLCLIFAIGVKASLKKSADEYVKAARGTVQEEVSVTGKVKPASAVDLSFEKSGKVTLVNKEVGDTVVAGDVIVKLDSKDILAQRAQMVAALSIQQARLAELQKGTRPEEITLSQSKVQNAQSDVALAQSALVTALQAGYSMADDAIRTKVDIMFDYPQSLNPRIKYIGDVQQYNTVNSGRVEVEKRLTELQTLSTIVSTSTTLTTVASVTQDLAEVKLFLDNLALYVNSLSQSQYPQNMQANITTWQAQVAAARTEVNSSITTILNSQSSFKQAQNNLVTLQGQLTIQQSGNVTEEIQAQMGQVAQARASVAAVDAQLSKLSIVSPIGGVITRQDARMGETVIPNTTIVSVMNSGQYDIEANIPEADIAKIKVGQKSSITLDAYGPDAEFQAVVVKIDPAETIIDNVPTYKTTFQFTKADDRIKSGMTANIDVIGESRENVIEVPERAIINRAGKKYVLVKQGEKNVEAEVITGLRGSDGSIEIMSGLNEGDEVVISQ